ncbi:hypothetical protein B0H13DRAFT_1919307 [Mycena leptocephala]|nr:hypothetical protein B0H13DRAFT_1919307 [Mycena leptocephala]
MANLSQTTTTASRSDPELEALVALVQCLAVASSEATRLATEVQAKLSSALNKPAASSINWVRGVPKTPLQMERAFPDGSGERRGQCADRRSPAPVPREEEDQADALACYRENYDATAAYDAAAALAATSGGPPPIGVALGVQKWIGVSVSSTHSSLL